MKSDTKELFDVFFDFADDTLADGRSVLTFDNFKKAAAALAERVQPQPQLAKDYAAAVEILKQYAQCGDGCTCGDGWSHDAAEEFLSETAYRRAIRFLRSMRGGGR